VARSPPRELDVAEGTFLNPGPGSAADRRADRRGCPGRWPGLFAREVANRAPDPDPPSTGAAVCTSLKGIERPAVGSAIPATRRLSQLAGDFAFAQRSARLTKRVRRFRCGLPAAGGCHHRRGLRAPPMEGQTGCATGWGWKVRLPEAFEVGRHQPRLRIRLTVGDITLHLVGLLRALTVSSARM